MSQKAVFSKAEAGKRNTLKIYVPSWVVIRRWFIVVLREAVEIACVCWRCNLWKGQSERDGDRQQSCLWESLQISSSHNSNHSKVFSGFFFTLFICSGPRNTAVDQKMLAAAGQQSSYWCEWPRASRGLKNFSSNWDKVGRKDLECQAHPSSPTPRIPNLCLQDPEFEDVS